ncbi:MAG: hypothetical protein WDN69_34595 [Aliidongia sp.]
MAASTGSPFSTAPGAASFGKDLRACARRSFWAYAIAAPATLLLIAISVAASQPKDAYLLAASEIVGDIVQAVGFRCCCCRCCAGSAVASAGLVCHRL